MLVWVGIFCLVIVLVVVWVFVLVIVSMAQLCVGVVRMGVFGGVAAFEDIDLGRGDPAAIGLLDGEGRVKFECGDGLMEDFWGDAGVDQCAEKHISADAGEAVKIGDTHAPYCFTEISGLLLTEIAILYREPVIGFFWTTLPSGVRIPPNFQPILSCGQPSLHFHRCDQGFLQFHVSHELATAKRRLSI
jgi:hypothetical protein